MFQLYFRIILTDACSVVAAISRTLKVNYTSILFPVDSIPKLIVQQCWNTNKWIRILLKFFLLTLALDVNHEFLSSCCPEDDSEMKFEYKSGIFLFRDSYMVAKVQPITYLNLHSNQSPNLEPIGFSKAVCFRLVAQSNLPLLYTHCDKLLNKYKDKSRLFQLKFNPDWSDGFSHKWVHSCEQITGPIRLSIVLQQGEKRMDFSATAHANPYIMNFVLALKNLYYLVFILIL